VSKSIEERISGKIEEPEPPTNVSEIRAILKINVGVEMNGFVAFSEVPQLFEMTVESVNISLSPGKRQRFLDWIRVT
jgi:hypothetical protein